MPILKISQHYETLARKMKRRIMKVIGGKEVFFALSISMICFSIIIPLLTIWDDCVELKETSYFGDAIGVFAPVNS